MFPAPRHYAESSATRDTTSLGSHGPNGSTPDSSPGADLGKLRDSQAPIDTPETKVSAASNDLSAADEEQVGVEMVEVALGHPRREGQVPYYIGR